MKKTVDEDVIYQILSVVDEIPEGRVYYSGPAAQGSRAGR